MSILFSCILLANSMMAAFSIEIRRFVSSANKVGWIISQTDVTSLIYIMNNRGPRFDPWGTP